MFRPSWSNGARNILKVAGAECFPSLLTRTSTSLPSTTAVNRCELINLAKAEAIRLDASEHIIRETVEVLSRVRFAAGLRPA
jgi:hypothetical protein